ncbi:response regulator [Gandjariella thermophila]|uniref:Transcriptional regulatory protein DevR (DosR) n=1 Tax=Gandjariella thermophila TaxID=1931992 RepID=A0A4D4IWL2_9PSEU|nr:response regulator transcription factor [Gandjariella thermophila]GDY28735.1 transcriptional regulatory protein DevR (DosR) [Gandjariella thermophila]
MATRVFLIDDHEVVRLGITDLVDTEPDLRVVGGASTVAEALDKVPTAEADVAVIDVRLPDGNGVELCRDLRSQIPDLRCLILTSFDDDEALFDAIMAGASGFVLKQVVGSELVASIRAVGAGESLLDRGMVSLLLNRLRRQQERADPLGRLSEQERQILELITEGMTNREIATRLHLSEKTVKNYVSFLLSKLSMRSRIQAAVFATELRLHRDSSEEQSR